MGEILGTNQVWEAIIFHEDVAYTIEMRLVLQVDNEHLSSDFKNHVLEKYARAFMYYRNSAACEKYNSSKKHMRLYPFYIEEEQIFALER